LLRAVAAAKPTPSGADERERGVILKTARVSPFPLPPRGF